MKPITQKIAEFVSTLYVNTDIEVSQYEFANIITLKHTDDPQAFMIFFEAFEKDTIRIVAHTSKGEVFSKDHKSHNEASLYANAVGASLKYNVFERA